MAAGGYPGSYQKNNIISGLGRDNGEDCMVFHAGTSLNGADVVTSGGRVLCIVGLGDSVESARDTAYSGVRNIDWENVYYRQDIGHRAIARERP